MSKLIISTKEATLEGFRIISGQTLAVLPIPVGLEDEARDLIAKLDLVDADAGTIDGDLDLRAAIKAAVPRPIKVIEIVTGKTIDMIIPFEIKVSE